MSEAEEAEFKVVRNITVVTNCGWNPDPRKADRAELAVLYAVCEVEAATNREAAKPAWSRGIGGGE